MTDYTIPLGEAVSLTTTWRNNNPGKKRAFTIDKEEIEQIFSNSNAEKIRVYFGEDANGMELILVGVDSGGSDILDPVYNHASPCPENCDSSSVLNG